jgi:hypothetical protein
MGPRLRGPKSKSGATKQKSGATISKTGATKTKSGGGKNAYFFNALSPRHWIIPLSRRHRTNAAVNSSGGAPPIPLRCA